MDARIRLYRVYESLEDTGLIQLTDEQEAAAQAIKDFINADTVERPWFTMHGYAGSGKTTVLGRIAREYPWAWVCTLTGRAAEVLRRKTGANAMTIHSAFYKLREKSAFSSGKERLKWDSLHRDGDLDGCVLLLDEVSMVDENIARDLIKTGVRIVACGDPGQLPPVAGKQFFTEADVTLKHIHRQALDSPILRQAHWVRLGRGYRPDGDDFRVVAKADRETVVGANAVLCWRNSTRRAVNAHVRHAKGISAVNPQSGEPVMCLKNAPDFGLYNGAIYELTQPFENGSSTIYLNVDGGEEKIPKIRFEGYQDALSQWDEMTTHFAFGYGFTVHKAQGAEYDNVLLIDEYSRDDFRKEWLYTAVTRAAKRITVVKA